MSCSPNDSALVSSTTCDFNGNGDDNEQVAMRRQGDQYAECYSTTNDGGGGSRISVSSSSEGGGSSSSSYSSSSSSSSNHGGPGGLGGVGEDDLPQTPEENMSSPEW